ncbi:MAG: thiamine diphosphokinase [Coriobacteriia bacterium]|nr:thiamine diphosphokinase [Coriobacteriia bacterium]
MERPANTWAIVAAADDFHREHFCALVASGAANAVVAVDGGFRHVRACGVQPALALGDFDSLGYVPDCPQVERHQAMKNESDLELALRRAQEEGVGKVVLYACLGGRLDHTLAALQTMAAAAEAGMEVQAVSLGAPAGEDPAAGPFALHVLVGPATLRIQAPPQAGTASAEDLLQGTVSVLSATDRCRGVTERGLLYQLDNHTLTNRTSRGLSNELVGTAAEISLDEGTLFVLYPAALEAAQNRKDTL